MNNLIKGCDRSHHNGVVDWKKERAQGNVFAFVKATKGTSFVDPQFQINYDGATQAGIMVGAYDFFRPEQDAMAQAKHFCTVVKTAKGKLPPVLDWEVADYVSTSTQISKAQLWLGVIQDNLGKVPLIYGGRDFLLSLKLPYALSKHGLYLAEYSTQPKVPAPWFDWTFWQNTDGGQTNLDSDYFRGSIDELRAL